MKATLEQLESIQKTGVSPFLLTRIKQRIAAVQANTIPPRTAIIVGVGFVLLLVLNYTAVQRATSITTKTQNVAEAMQLTTTTSLYH